MALLPDLGTEIVIPVCAGIGIIFSLVQWYLVSRVRVSPERGGSRNGKDNGYSLIEEEEEGVNDHAVIAKCAEIQTAISEGLFFCSRSVSDFARSEFLFVFWFEFCLVWQNF